MLKKNSAAIRRYYRRIRGWIPGPIRLKRMILADIQENVSIYLEEFPEASMDQIEAHFGTPKGIAAEYVRMQDMPNLLTELRVGKRITTIVIAGIIAALLSWAIGVTAAVEKRESDFGGYHVTNIIE